MRADGVCQIGECQIGEPNHSSHRTLQHVAPTSLCYFAASGHVLTWRVGARSAQRRRPSPGSPGHQFQAEFALAAGTKGVLRYSISLCSASKARWKGTESAAGSVVPATATAEPNLGTCTAPRANLQFGIRDTC